MCHASFSGHFRVVVKSSRSSVAFFATYRLAPRAELTLCDRNKHAPLFPYADNPTFVYVLLLRLCFCDEPSGNPSQEVLTPRRTTSPDDEKVTLDNEMGVVSLTNSDSNVVRF
ncbi:hypothetical protein BCR42DRAFT_497308 [Absidia repens]|uniref:Uncharacterized protein n=1 Tax=Absidia repens TaxID=90262 RepID=A0A1X2HK71_9FUNG|nr:hypothetical protein BCR42DRAFT_497308 [Absidia repens]